jgi:hypothetical protein
MKSFKVNSAHPAAPPRVYLFRRLLPPSLAHWSGGVFTEWQLSQTSKMEARPKHDEQR